MSDSPKPILTARQYGWITAAFILFVVYGSLVPLTFRAMPLDKAWNRFVWIFSKPVAVDQRSDWLANILLFIPLGFVAMGWLCVDRPNRMLWPIVLILPGCTLLSASLEFTQLWFPPRDTSLNDVVAETLGGAIGIGIWRAAGRRSTEFIRQFWSVHGERNWAMRMIPGYLVLLAFVHGMPFDLTLSPSHLKKKYHAGMVLPIPFTIPGGESLDLVRKAIINAAYFLPGGLLLAGLPGWIGRDRRAGWRVLGIGVVLAAAIEGMQLFVLSRYCDSTDIITGSLAVWLGWRAMRAWLDRHRADAKSPASFPKKTRLGLFVSWVAALAFINWEPFDFSADAEFLAQRWRDLSFVPFADYYRGNYLNSFNDILQNVLLFVPVGLLLSGRLGTRHDGVIVVSAALAAAAFLEVGQFFLRRHSPGVSDLIVEPFGAWLGLFAAKRVRVLAAGSQTTKANPNRVVAR